MDDDQEKLDTILKRYSRDLSHLGKDNAYWKAERDNYVPRDDRRHRASKVARGVENMTNILDEFAEIDDTPENKVELLQLMVKIQTLLRGV